MNKIEIHEFDPKTGLLNLPEFILKSRQPRVVIFQSRSNVGPPFGFARFPQRIAQIGEA